MDNKVFGMKERDFNTLCRMLHQPKVEPIPSVAEYIQNHKEVKTEERISKKGNKIIRVYYPNGMVIDYELCRIDTSRVPYEMI